MWAHELLKTLVFEYRVVSFEYFMHEMSISEAYLCSENIKWTDIIYRSYTRYSIWNMYNSNPWIKGGNKIKVQEVLELPWDEGTILSKEEKEKTKKIQKSMEEMLKNAKVVEEKYM